MEGLNSVLDWLTGADAGAFVVLLFLMSWGFEGAAWFQKLSGRARELLTLAGAALLAVGAVVLQGQPELVDALDPYFKPVMYIVLAWLAKEGAHKLNPARTENAVKNWSKDPSGFYSEVG